MFLLLFDVIDNNYSQGRAGLLVYFLLGGARAVSEGETFYTFWCGFRDLILEFVTIFHREALRFLYN